MAGHLQGLRDDAIAYDYRLGSSIPLAKLLVLLAQLPENCIIWPNEVTGNLAASMPDKTYLGYVDCGREEWIPAFPTQMAGDGNDGFFG